jgi:hypothetical protein
MDTKLVLNMVENTEAQQVLSLAATPIKQEHLSTRKLRKKGAKKVRKPNRVWEKLKEKSEALGLGFRLNPFGCESDGKGSLLGGRGRGSAG